MTHDRSNLEASWRAGKRPKLLHFWGHQPSKDGSISASCFSQWWTARFVIDGIVYPTAEHWMMAGKARLFADEAALAGIVKAGSPKQAKAVGREVRNFDAARWDQAKREIVFEGNLAKFSQNSQLADFLVGTGKKVLVEASPVDRIWGIGLAADDAKADNPLQWRGENLLGFVLMDVRDKLTGPAQ